MSRQRRPRTPDRKARDARMPRGLTLSHALGAAIRQLAPLPPQGPAAPAAAADHSSLQEYSQPQLVTPPPNAADIAELFYALKNKQSRVGLGPNFHILFPWEEKLHRDYLEGNLNINDLEINEWDIWFLTHAFQMEPNHTYTSKPHFYYTRTINSIQKHYFDLLKPHLLKITAGNFSLNQAQIMVEIQKILADQRTMTELLVAGRLWQQQQRQTLIYEGGKRKKRRKSRKRRVKRKTKSKKRKSKKRRRKRRKTRRKK